jgi:hypothetical protein
LSQPVGQHVVEHLRRYHGHLDGDAEQVLDDCVVGTVRSRTSSLWVRADSDPNHRRMTKPQVGGDLRSE